MSYDSRTGYPKLRKTAYMDRLFAFDFASLLEGNTIASINSVTATAQGIVTEVTAITVGATAVDGTLATVRLSGGTDGEDYVVQCKITDSAGNDLDSFGILQVRDAA